jgi:hypothetical protein
MWINCGLFKDNSPSPYAFGAASPYNSSAKVSPSPAPGRLRTDFRKRGATKQLKTRKIIEKWKSVVTSIAKIPKFYQNITIRN